MTPRWPLALDDVHHVFEGERLEVEAVGGVVVGRDRLRVAVDHDRLDARLLEREGRVHARVVELDPLADAVGPGAEDDHLVPRRGWRLVLLLVGRVEVGGGGDELGGAGVHHLEGRRDAGPQARGADLRLGLSAELGDPPVRKTHLLGLPKHVGVAGARGDDLALEEDDLADVLEEPRIDRRKRVQLLGGHTAPVALRHREAALDVGHADLLAQALVVRGRPVHHEPPAVLLERADGLLERLLEGATDGHGLAHRLHLRGQRLVRLGEFLEGPARKLDPRK